MVSINPENFIPGPVIGFILLGFCWIYLSPQKNKTNKKNFVPGKPQFAVSNNSDQELKMVLIVRQDLKMKSGKIASQCAHAATGMYVDLMQRVVKYHGRRPSRRPKQAIQWYFASIYGLNRFLWPIIPPTSSRNGGITSSGFWVRGFANRS